MDHQEIANTIKTVDLDQAVREWDAIACATDEELAALTGRSRLGCGLIDRYFLRERMETIGNKGISFFEFVERFDEEYKTKPYIVNLLRFCDKNNRYVDSIVRRQWYCYGLCFGRIGAFKITNALTVYRAYRPTSIIDPFAGFGGRMVAAMIAGIAYQGFDTNEYLEPAYDRLKTEFAGRANSRAQVVYSDALSVDYSTMQYDMVFTSPPYENIEQYRHSPVRTREEWDVFYNTIFAVTWNNLMPGGVFAINISHPIYLRILVPMLGAAETTIVLKKSTRNNYGESIYVWTRPLSGQG